MLCSFTVINHKMTYPLLLPLLSLLCNGFCLCSVVVLYSCHIYRQTQICHCHHPMISQKNRIQMFSKISVNKFTVTQLQICSFSIIHIRSKRDPDKIRIKGIFVAKRQNKIRINCCKKHFFLFHLKTEGVDFQLRLCKDLNSVQTHKCLILTMGLHIFEINLC